MLNNVNMWQAARATSAATTFFDPIEFCNETFIDGATGANNPIFQLWNEAEDIWGEEDDGFRLEDHIRCLVSIGTGLPSMSPFEDDVLHISKTLGEIATNTQREADLFHRHHAKLFQLCRAFRFNVDQGLEGIGLQEASKLNKIITSTRAYLETESTFQNVKKCAENLKSRQCKLVCYRRRSFVQIDYRGFG